MSGVKVECVKTGLNNYSAKSKNISEKENKVSIMDRGIVSDKENCKEEISASSAEIESMYDKYTSILNNENTLKDMGCPPLKGAANIVSSKAKAVADGVANELMGFEKEFANILKDASLSEEEKKSKIELLEAKKKAMIQEGDMKLSILEKISDSLLDMLPMFMMLKEMGANTNSLTETIKKLAGNISASPSSFKNVKNMDELKKTSAINMKNIFGKGSAEEMKKAVDKIDKKIKDKEQRDKDQFENYSDRMRYKEEVKVLKLQKKLLTEVLKKLDSIKTDENS